MEALCNHRPHVGDAGQLFKEWEQPQQRGVLCVIVPGSNGNAIVQLVPKHLLASIAKISAFYCC